MPASHDLTGEPEDAARRGRAPGLADVRGVAATEVQFPWEQAPSFASWPASVPASVLAAASLALSLASASLPLPAARGRVVPPDESIGGRLVCGACHDDGDRRARERSSEDGEGSSRHPRESANGATSTAGSVGAGQRPVVHVVHALANRPHAAFVVPCWQRLRARRSSRRAVGGRCTLRLRPPPVRRRDDEPPAVVGRRAARPRLLRPTRSLPRPDSGSVASAGDRAEAEPVRTTSTRGRPRRYREGRGGPSKSASCPEAWRSHAAWVHLRRALRFPSAMLATALEAVAARSRPTPCSRRTRAIRALTAAVSASIRAVKRSRSASVSVVEVPRPLLKSSRATRYASCRGGELTPGRAEREFGLLFLAQNLA